jgi:hypothetical protein
MESKKNTLSITPTTIISQTKYIVNSLMESEMFNGKNKKYHDYLDTLTNEEFKYL